MTIAKEIIKSETFSFPQEKAPLFHVIFLGTSTKEKIRDFNLIAQHKGYPAVFFDLRKLIGSALHNTTEDGGSVEDNAGKKLKGIQNQIAYCRAHPEMVGAFCKRYGIDYQPECVWFGSEDSGVAMPKIIWDHIPKDVVKSLLPDEIVKRLEKLFAAGPDVETAPYLSAMLGVGNLEALIEAALKNIPEEERPTSLRDLKFEEKSVLTLKRMKPLPLEQEADMVLKALGMTENNFASKPYQGKDEIEQRHSSLDFVAPPSIRGVPHNSNPARELGHDYIVNYSARAAAFRELRIQINALQPMHPLVPVHYRNGLGKAIGKPEDLWLGIGQYPPSGDFRISVMNHETPEWPEALKKCIEEKGKIKEEEEAGQNIFTLIADPNAMPDAEPPNNLSEMERATYYLSYPERVLSQSDGVILVPDSMRKTPSSLEEKLYTLQSIVVAKQLVLRDMDKPVIVLNTDRSWDKAIDIHTKLANCNMTKDYILPLTYDLGKEVKVSSNAYFDIINGGNEKAAMQAAATLMKDRSLSYHRVKEKPAQCFKEGPPPSQKEMTAIFCSASCENKPLNDLVKDIACRMTHKGKGIICGGGDRYTMGAILGGVMKWRQQNQDVGYIAGISTEPIAASETEEGRISSHYNYRELTGDIYERMAKMLLPAENVLVAPGGAGTIQEWMGFNLLKKKMPDIFENKKLVIFDPELIPEIHPSFVPAQNKVFDDIIHIIFGAEKLAHQLHFNHTRTHIVATVEGVEQCLGLTDWRSRLQQPGTNGNEQEWTKTLKKQNDRLNQVVRELETLM